jgi:hypothetical protein
MYLKLRGLVHLGGPRRPKKGKQKMNDDPTMLLKTKKKGEAVLDEPTMFIKTNNLTF